MLTDLHYTSKKNYTLPDTRLFNSAKIMFYLCLIITALIVYFAAAKVYN